MSWWTKPEPAPPPPAAPAAQPVPERSVAEALRAYGEQFDKSLQGPQSEETRRAEELLAKARQIINESGLGHALAPTLLEHVQDWPAQSQRADFVQSIGFPCRYISGSREEDKHDEKKMTVVSFAYKEAVYTVRLVSTDISAGSGIDAYGQVYLQWGDQEVLGLDVSHEISARWRWLNVFVFQPGSWMQDLIEMDSYIAAKVMKGPTDRRAADIQARASRVRLP
jgi:hypothetical protein